MTKKFLIPIIVLSLLLSGCNKNESNASISNKNVLITVNGEPIFEE